MGMCDSVGECTCCGADPRALLCSDAGAVVWACEHAC